jgi:hypothetical protein
VTRYVSLDEARSAAVEADKGFQSQVSLKQVPKKVGTLKSQLPLISFNILETSDFNSTFFFLRLLFYYLISTTSWFILFRVLNSATVYTVQVFILLTLVGNNHYNNFFIPL